MSDENDYLDAANNLLDEATDPPLSLEQYVERVLDEPRVAAQSAQYLLDAIEHEGTRTVIEDGEEKERWRFFDDPNNDGEHAVLGNTDVLNSFVDELRLMANSCAAQETILWVGGPTATGKSELKRCLISGLREYSKTDAGARYTTEWNISPRETGNAMTYGDAGVEHEDDWYRSPVNSHPLTVLPGDVRDDLLFDLNATLDDRHVCVEESLDPFCREAYNALKERYERAGEGRLFDAITAPQHLRVVRQSMDVGDGIGVLHSEDDGSPKERLVGSWMPGMLSELDSRGRKHPQAFSYDGVLAQGNGGLTIVEDASQHADVLQKLLNVADERMVKLDTKIPMDIDTVLLIISNPDLDAKLNQYADKGASDPMKALKRRLDKHEFNYLTGLGDSVELLRRELTDNRCLPDEVDDDRIAEAVEVNDCEFAPHALEAAGLYSVVTRLYADDIPSGLDLVDKALLFDHGYYEDDEGRRHDIDEYDFDDDAPNGVTGMPVTYTRDVLADQSQNDEVILPQDALDALVDNLGDESMFSSKEVTEFERRVDPVTEYVEDKQEEDVIAAILRAKQVDDDTINEYIDHVYSWGTDDDTIEDPDPLTMKVFEVEYLGRFSEKDYDGHNPNKKEIEDFRHDTVITAINSYIWENRDEDFQFEDLSYRDVPALRQALGEYTWDDVRRRYENLNPAQWRDASEGTETHEVKEEALQNMQELFGYSEESARQTSARVMDAQSGESAWD